MEESAIENIEKKLDFIALSVNSLENAQKVQSKQNKNQNLNNRLELVERKQDEILRILTALRSELAGISSGMARRDSLILGSSVVSGIAIRRDSIIGGDQNSRRNSLILPDYYGRSSIPVMEVEPWELTLQVQEIVNKLFERQFVLTPWVREKRLRNQLRLILKDHLDAGPKRRSTITKLVHDAHQIFPIWRNQIRDKMFQDWENIQELNPKEASNIIFDGFKKSRQNDEIESMSLYAEHMIEVGQYLKRKLADRAERAGRQPGNVTNSKFWYEVRKKIQEVLQQEKEMGIKRDIEIDDDDSDDILVSQNGAESEDEIGTDVSRNNVNNGHVEIM